MTSEDLKAMRADLTAALGPMAAANVFFAWAEAIRVRMEREARTNSETSDQASLGRSQNTSSYRPSEAWSEGGGP